MTESTKKDLTGFFPQNFERKAGELSLDGVNLSELAAQFGTPLYIYSASTLTEKYTAISSMLQRIVPKSIVCVAVKACSNLSILSHLASQGAGFDVVSGGELKRIIAIGADTKKVVFAGVGKQEDEIKLALEHQILMFNVESEAELEKISKLATTSKKAAVSLRINPNVETDTHALTQTGGDEHKFGIPLERAMSIYARHAQYPTIDLCGIDCHIGSGICDLTAFEIAFKKLASMIEQVLQLGVNLRYIDIGGGLGVRYSTEQPPSLERYSQIIKETVGRFNLPLILEPGKWIFAEAGALVSKVIYTKETLSKKFVIIDAAMNDLIRPALYESHHEIAPVVETKDRALTTVDVVGPVCETGDFLALARALPELRSEELVAIFCAGAYGFTMSSNYNSRGRAAEVLVSKGKAKLIRSRESFEEIIFDELKLLKS
jgi:diaminopimelate decarboxylase